MFVVMRSMDLEEVRGLYSLVAKGRGLELEVFAEVFKLANRGCVVPAFDRTATSSLAAACRDAGAPLLFLETEPCFRLLLLTPCSQCRKLVNIP